MEFFDEEFFRELKRTLNIGEKNRLEYELLYYKQVADIYFSKHNELRDIITDLEKENRELKMLNYVYSNKKSDFWRWKS